MGFLPFVSRMWAEQQDGLFNLMLRKISASWTCFPLVKSKL